MKDLIALVYTSVSMMMSYLATDTLFTIRDGNNAQLPLYTKDTSIVDAIGHTIHFVGVNWPGHMDYMIPEGLHAQSVENIVGLTKGMGFNTVRLTFSVQMVDEHYRHAAGTSEYLVQKIVPSSLWNQMMKNNRWIEGLSPIEVFDRIIMELTSSGMMVILDNHVSKAGWCCSENDGNGFFNDKYFKVDEWMRSLEFMAARYADNSHVVGISLRNEIRNSQNWDAWYQYMHEAGRRVHEHNPGALIIVSGLNYDTDLSPLYRRPFSTTFDEKLVFELHWYKWSLGDSVDKCWNLKWIYHKKGGFMLKKKRPYSRPLIMSELGLNLNDYKRGTSEFKYMKCVASWLRSTGISFAWWGIQGSYYIRDGVELYDESYGLLNKEWSAPRNPNFLFDYRFLFSDNKYRSEPFYNAQ